MFFEIVSTIDNISTIAQGRGVRSIKALRKPGRWRKMKGTAEVRLADEQLRQAEIHWYDSLLLI